MGVGIMKAFKVGDKVRLKADLPRSDITGFISDLQMDLADRSISSTAFDAFERSILDRSPMIITRIDYTYGEPAYECMIANSRTRREFPFVFIGETLESLEYAKFHH